MVAIREESQKMTIEEYLEWEPQQEIRYEYLTVAEKEECGFIILI
jgi:hypothetical protein